MITLKDLLDSAELQSTAKYYYYDYDKEQRIELTEEEAGQYEIKYIYEVLSASRLARRIDDGA